MAAVMETLTLFLGVLMLRANAQDEILFRYEFQDPGYTGACPSSDWVLNGTACYKVIASELVLEDAQSQCESLGASLLTVNDFTFNDNIGEIVRATDPSITSWWMGMKYTGDGDLTSFDTGLMAEWIDGSATDLRVAPLWATGEPNLETGDCVKVTNPGDGTYPWQMTFCTEEVAYVCAAQVCMEDQFLCYNSKCISNVHTCDGFDHCGDGSDETDCDGTLPCTELISGSDSGTVRSQTGSSYSNSANCKWTIEGPVGSKIRLQFTSFETEKDFDVVDVWQGGRTIPTSSHVAKISGALPEQAEFISTNNYMIISFSSDSLTNGDGFVATWKTTYSCAMESLMGYKFSTESVDVSSTSTGTLQSCINSCLDDTNCKSFSYDNDNTRCHYHDQISVPVEDLGFDYVVRRCPDQEDDSDSSILPGSGGLFPALAEPHIAMSPFYPLAYYSGMRIHWRLDTAASSIRLTVQILEVDIGSEDMFIVHDGRDQSADAISRFIGSDSDEAYDISMTTQQYAYVTFETGSYMAGKHGVMFKYFQGCRIEIEATTTIVQSPSYLAGSYGANMDCSWVITNADQTGASITFPDDYEYDIDDDRLKIFDGTTADDTALHTNSDGFTGSTAPATAITSSEGSFYIQFESSGSNEGRGFYAIYSINCPGFNIDDMSIDDDSVFSEGGGSSFGNSFTLSCAAGTYFSHEEFGNEDEITMECLHGGKWNYRTEPLCAPVVCGFPEGVPNGYVTEVSSIDKDGETTYECFEGFDLDTTNPPVCDSNGDWGGVPVCEATSCSPVASSEHLMVMYNNTVDEDSPTYGAIASLSCDDGFYLDGGAHVVYCQHDGSWSSTTVPECMAKQCVVPTVEYGSFAEDAGELVDVGETITLTCNNGFTMDGSDDHECLADLTFGNVSMCIDNDECGDDGDANCEYMELCLNHPGGYVCSCPDGYTLDSGSGQCDDIDECQDGNGGCEDSCTNTDPGYTCGCPDGYTVFESEGFMGYEKLPDEDGTGPLDLMRYNHTCVRKECPSEWLDTAFDNGEFLTDGERQHYYYEDEVDVLCNLGFVTDEDTPLMRYTVTCADDATWQFGDSNTVVEDDAANLPPCMTAKCPPVDKDNLGLDRSPDSMDPPEANDNEIDFGTEITFTCTHPIKSDFELTQTCLFDTLTDEYRLLGDNLECGQAECGPIPTIPGRDTSNDGDLSTLYSDQFGNTVEFSCVAGYTPSGTSEHGTEIDGGTDQTISCQLLDGVLYWDLGSLQCVGPSCSDPGRPSDSTQISTSYAEGSQVTFNCTRSGYELDDDTPLTCNANNGNPEWSGSLPTCIDTQDPTFTGCDEIKRVPKFRTLADIPISPSDNTGIATITADEDIRLPVTEDINVTYTATDFQANSADCMYIVVMTDNSPPEITCENSVTRYILLDEESDTITTDPELPEVVDAADIVVEPSEIQSSRSDLNSIHVVEYTATDEYGNEATCRQQYTVQARNCRTWVLRDPLNSQTDMRTCVTNTDTNEMICTFTCEPNFFFFYDNEFTDTFTHKCDFDTGDWDSRNVLDCIEVDVNSTKTDATFQMDYTLSYNGASLAEHCTQPYLAKLQALQSTLGDNLQASCENLLPDVDVTVTVDSIVPGTIIAVLGYLPFDVHMTIGPSDIDEQYLTACASTVQNQLSTTNIPILASTSMLDTIVDVSGPPGSDPCYDATFITSEEQDASLVCETGGVLQGTQCAACPTGTYYTDDPPTCTPCDRGFYSSETAQNECQPCPDNKSTYSEGATHEDLCYDLCPPGFRSETGLAPCVPCAEDFYWTDSTTCTTCGINSTSGMNAVSSIDGCKAPCPAGYFSFNGYYPCDACPIGYYADGEESMDCTACSDSTSTAQLGSTSEDDCVAAGELCAENPCTHGTCSIDASQIQCSCNSGYTGLLCETEINECDSQPCFHNGACEDDVDSYTCSCDGVLQTIFNVLEDQSIGGAVARDLQQIHTRTECEQTCLSDDNCGFYVYSQEQTRCFIYTSSSPIENVDGQTAYQKAQVPTSVYTGDNCEIEENECELNDPNGITQCGDNGMCRDMPTGFECLCIPPYVGEFCDTRESICTSAECLNGGECIPMPDNDSAERRRCVCPPGFSGENCEIDENECLSDPCLYGGTCRQVTAANDGDLRFACTCPEGFSGARCGTRSSDLCQGVTCGNLGECYENYEESSPLCICELGSVTGEIDTEWFDTPRGEDVGDEDESLAAHEAANGGSICGDSPPLRIECVTTDDGTLSSASNDVFDEGFECTIEGGLVCHLANQTNADSDCEDFKVRYFCPVPDGNCQPLEECHSNPCMYGGVCESLVNGYSCDCLGGYDGHHCQYEINECSSDPCQNDGSCQDGVDHYNCTCEDGFSGVHCEINNDDCDPDLCENGICIDGVDSYSCDCESGWTSTNCDMDFDECDSSPCLNGGVCDNQPDMFECTCEAGWTGVYCEAMIDTCEVWGDECTNGARCWSIYNDTFCACVPGTAGEICDIVHSICEFDAVCMNGGTCVLNDEGAGTCECTTAYSGDNCEKQRDYCGTENNVCQNNAICTLIDDDPGYHCNCLDGFDGDTCEINIDDCADVTCRNNGVCIDGVAQSFCKCEFGNSGPTCEKETDRDYDLWFNGEGGTKSLRPYLLNRTDILTIAMWVQFAPDTNGTLMCIHEAESENNPEISDTIIFCIGSYGVKFYADDVIIPFVDNINTGLWHALDITWNDGDVRALVDGLGSEETDATPLLDAMPEYVMITIGDGEPMYSGSLTRLLIWDKLLSAGQLNNVRDPLYTGTDTERLLVDWDGYVLAGAVQRRLVSRLCRGDGCSGVQDTPLPVLANECQGDIIVGGSNAIHQASWTVPEFNHETSVHKNYGGNDGTFNPGIYDVLYLAVNADDSSAKCQFRVTVRGGVCADPEQPDGVENLDCAAYSVPAANEDDLVDLYNGCTISCEDNKGFLEPVPKLFTCGALGTWEAQGAQVFRFPACGDLGDASMRVVFGWTYEITVSATEGALNLLKTAFTESFTSWDEDIHSGEFCGDATCSEMECILTDTATGTSSATVEVECIIEDTGTELDNRPLADVLEAAIKSEDSLVYVDTVPGASEIDFSTVYIQTRVFCDVGYQAVNDQCVECTVGTYFDDHAGTENDVCIKCPIGQYQSEVQQLNCTICPDGKTTESIGASSLEDCFLSCLPGTKYNEETESCDECPIGHYQPEAGQAICLSCGTEKTTHQNGTSSVEDCIDDCPSGYTLQVDGECLSCSKGTYRAQGLHQHCLACPANYTTLNDSATSEVDCDIVLCPNGKYRVNDECFPCDYGWWRMGIEMENCTACDEGTTTEEQGAISADSCTLFCNAGMFIDDTSCSACPANTFKTDSIEDRFAEECHNCSDDMRTLDEGSISEDLCVYKPCTAGEVYDNATDSCVRCGYGFYQPEPFPTDHMCIECDAGKSTDIDNATLPTDCRDFCDSGLEMIDNSCVSCERGYYKDNGVNKENDFGTCEICPTGYITAGEGATSVDNCTIANCSAGSMLNDDQDACTPCPVQYYQPDKWQTECIRCEDNDSTTSDVGSTSPDQCNVFPYYDRFTFRVTFTDLVFTDALTDENSAEYIALSIRVIAAIRLQFAAFNGLNGYDNDRVFFTGFLSGSVIAVLDTTLDNRVEGGCSSNCEAQLGAALEDATAGGELDGLVVIEADPDMDINPVLDAGSDCDAGAYEPFDDQGQCEPCPVNTYHKEMTNICIPCKDGYGTHGTTDTGKTSEDDCAKLPFLNYINFRITLTEKTYTDALADDSSAAYNALKNELVADIQAHLNTIDTLSSNYVKLVGFVRGSVIAVLENALDTRECGDTCESDFDNALVAMTGENNDLGGGAQPANPEIDVQEVDDADQGAGCDAGQYIPFAADSVCVPCPVNTYHKADTNICIHCDEGAVTYGEPNTGKTTVADCVGTCVAGQFRSDDGTCLPCPANTYSDEENAECKPCEDELTAPAPTGDIGLTACLNPCEVNPDHCLSGGTCFYYPEAEQKLTCHCMPEFDGDKCQNRKDPDDDAPLIIGFSVGVVALLMAIVLLVLMCYRIRVPMKPKKKKPPPNFPQTQSNIMPTPRNGSQPPNSYAPMGVASQAHPVRIAPPGQMLDQNTAPFKFYEDREEQIPSASQFGGTTQHNYAGSTAFFQR